MDLDGTGASTLFLLNPTGGVLGGDGLETRVDLGAGCHVCLSTPSATRVYRSAGSPARQHMSARVGAGACFEYMPDHVIPSPGARFIQSIDLELAPGAAAVLCDAWSVGRPARGEAWLFDLLDSSVTARDSEGLLFKDRFALHGARSAESLAMRQFQGEPARALFAGMSAHAALPLDRPFTAAFGLILGAALAFIIRPVLVGLCLIPAGLKSNERTFVLFAGLKGAVPILLGSFLLAAHVPGAERLYGIVAVVVVFSVVVQGSLTPAAARLLHVPMRTVAPEPWALGVRLRDEPSGVHRLTIKPRSPADGRTIADLAGLPGDAWISFIVRDGQLVPNKGDTRLQAGDDVLVLAPSELHNDLTTVFEGRHRR